MNKSLKKTFVLALCAVLCVISTFSCFAKLIPLKPTDSKGVAIRVELDSVNDDASLASMRATAFRIIKVNVMDSEDGSLHQPKEPVYYWAPGVADWIKAHDDYKKYINADDNAVTEEYTKYLTDENVPSTNEEYIGFIDALASAIRTNLYKTVSEGTGVDGINFVIGDDNTYVPGGTNAAGEEIPLVKTQQFTSGSKVATIDGLSKGSYIVLIENGSRIYQPAIANLTPSYRTEAPDYPDNGFDKEGWYVDSPAKVHIKASDVSIKKMVSDESATAAGKDVVTAGMDDTVYYTITADVPKYSDNAISKTFNITDLIPKGVTINTTMFKVYGVAGGAETELTSATGGYSSSSVTLTEDEKAAYSSKIQVSFNDYSKIAGYDKIKIVYEAVVNQDAVLGKAGNSGAATLTYANNPYANTGVKTDTDDAIVYTYGFKLTKTSADANPVLLPGAVFEVHKKNGNDWVQVHFEKTGNGLYDRTLEGENHVQVETGNTVDGDSSMLGVLKLNGLDVGTYKITEVKAPEGGYLLLKDPIEFYIVDEKAAQDDGTYAAGPDGIPDMVDNKGKGQDTNQTSDDAQKGYVVRLVKNSTGFNLPLTGGMGTVLFTVGGAALIVGAVVLLLVANRKKSRCN